MTDRCCGDDWLLDQIDNPRNQTFFDEKWRGLKEVLGVSYDCNVGAVGLNYKLAAMRTDADLMASFGLTVNAIGCINRALEDDKIKLLNSIRAKVLSALGSNN